MFSLKSQITSQEDPFCKSKSAQYKKDSVRKDKQTIIQSQRYFNFSSVLDWRMNINAFRNKVQAEYNYYTLLNTLFVISQEMNWREYIVHMNVLISTFHKIVYSKQLLSLHDLKKLKDFQSKLSHLFLLKDLALHQHLMLLLKMLLAFNPKYLFMKESKYSQILIESATYNDLDAITQILWILSQIEVSSVALVKLFKQDSVILSIQKSDICLLPCLTIIANFMSNTNQNHNIVEQLVTSNMFQKIFQLGLSSKKVELLNQTVLIFNNGLCYSPFVRKFLQKQEKMIEIILSLDCQEKNKCLQLLKILESNHKNISRTFKSVQ